MTSPGPDASVPSPQGREAAAEKDPQPELNGHVAPVISKAKDEPEAKPRPETTVESQTEPAASKEKSADPPVDSPSAEAEKPLVNGNGTAGDHASPNGAAPDAVEAQKDAAPETETDDPNKSPTPKAAHESEAAASVPAATAATATETKPGSQDSHAADEPVKASEDSAAAQSEDVQMADSAPEKESTERARQIADEAPSAPSACPAKAPEPDMEMTDTSGEADSAAKPASSDAAPPSGDAAAAPTSELDLGPTDLSQLNIGTTEKALSPVGPSADISMSDAPAPSSKVAREREDDAAEEPASKRAKTETMDDGTGDTLAAGPDAIGLDGTALTRLSQWEDSETKMRSISPFQRREIRKIIGRVKKTKSGGHFRDSVQKLWPLLWDGYVERIDKPMDLGELDRTLREPSSPIATYGDFKANLAIIFENALSFNGTTHEVTFAAASVVRTIWEEVLPIPEEEPARPKAVPKQKPARESRAVINAETAARHRSAGPAAASPAAEAPAVNPPASAAADQEPSGDWRSSTATDGDRPKRTVRAPKPKDIDYTTKPSRKKLKPELPFCDEVLMELMHPKNHSVNKWFMEPVDAEGLNIPTYYAQIKKPMDLGKVQRLLASGEIASLKDFDKSVRLIFDNCYKFNGPPGEGNPVSILGKQLEDLYMAQMKNKDAWLSRHAAKANNAAAASASIASDDEDEDEDEGDDAADLVADDKEIEELQARLEEETKKLNGMLLGGNQSLIITQKGIVNIVQDALVKAAQNVQQSRTKGDKAKKAGKSAKVTGGQANRKAMGGTAQPKKASGAKKPAPKKMLTAAEKDQVASAINDLEYPHIDRAIEIIKKDTGQNENTDGELELDIDQLSNDALYRLWELCKKALPGFGKDARPTPNASPEANRSGGATKAPKVAAKPKNKPMSAQEQEARIAQLTALRNLYKPGQEPAEAPKATQAATAESSDDSDSEEE